ncbi:MAG: homoserine kinase [Oscillospiraceae bacterium]
MFKIRIPATSANLGAGFDSLGLAVNLYNYVSMEENDIIDIKTTDDSIVPDDERNLIYSSAKVLFDLAGKKLSGLKIIQENNVPMTRGLGSSSACIIGGLVGANKLLNNKFSPDELCSISAKIEGHPDNTSPALLGGIVTSVMSDEKVFFVKQELIDAPNFIAIIPDFHLSTALSRQCLPTQVSHLDARYNISRAALFATSLIQHKYENIKIAVQDKLHQSFRLDLIEHSNEIFAKAYENNALGVYLSGAGPTIMSIVDKNQDEFIKNMRSYLDAKGLNNWNIIKLSVDNEGAKIL